MGFLDNSSITVDAVLTKKGREILSRGGNLDINAFTVTDTGVDYTLWNADHPSGSAYYGEAIENLPQLESSVHARYSMRNRLVTLPINTITVPTLDIEIPGSQNFTVTFEDGDVGAFKQVTAHLKGFAPNNGTQLYGIIETPNVCSLRGELVQEISGISRDYIREADLKRSKVYLLQPHDTSNVMWNIGLSPDTTQTVAGRQTEITFIEGRTGAWGSITVQNNIIRLHRNLMSTTNTKG